MGGPRSHRHIASGRGFGAESRGSGRNAAPKRLREAIWRFRSGAQRGSDAKRRRVGRPDARRPTRGAWAHPTRIGSAAAHATGVATANSASIAARTFSTISGHATAPFSAVARVALYSTPVRDMKSSGIGTTS